MIEVYSFITAYTTELRLNGRGWCLVDNKVIVRMVIAGGLVGILGIALFFGLWFFLGTITDSAFARVVVSVCLPPIILATIFGVYYLVVRPGAPADEPANRPSDKTSPDA